MNLDAVGILSKDFARTRLFFSILGVELKPVGSEDHLEGITDQGVRIMVDSEQLMQKIYPAKTLASGSNLVLCEKKDSALEVDRCFSEMIEQGFVSIKKPWNAFWGQRYASVLGPDSFQLDIFADLEITN
jgi:predicted lactoylglutathione lyase